jgi:hypothetical protein
MILQKKEWNLKKKLENLYYGIWPRKSSSEKM